MFDSVDNAHAVLSEHSCVADFGLGTSLFLAFKMEKALFLEGEPVVGKTELARVLSQACNAPLIRLQYFEDLDHGAHAG